MQNKHIQNVKNHQIMNSTIINPVTLCRTTETKENIIYTAMPVGITDPFFSDSLQVHCNKKVNNALYNTYMHIQNRRKD